MLTARSERLRRDPLTAVLRRRFSGDRQQPPARRALAAAPIIIVAVDLAEPAMAINDALRAAAAAMLASLPSARLACINILQQGRINLDTNLDEQGHNKHVDRMVGLKRWVEPLQLSDDRLTVHVIEAIDPAAAILEFATANRADHILVGARQNSLLHKLLGSVSAEVAAAAPCSVTIVRPRSPGDAGSAGPGSGFPPR